LPNSQLTETNFRTYNPDYSVSGDQKIDLQRMKAYPLQHSDAEKRIFTGKPGAVLIDAETPAPDALRKALDALFNHPNVGPFVARQLIQRLVTSAPSPAYVARVTAVFNDDGRRTRGNMAAVVKAILMDPEARGAVNRQPGFGKLREPVVDVAAVLRALGARTDGEYPNYVAFLMGQPLFGAATVFSFYPPNYPLPKSMSLVAPQFGVLNTASASARLNFISATVYAQAGLVFPPDPTVPGAIGTTVDLTAYSRVAEQGADELLRRLNEDLLHGTMGAAETAAITSAVQAVPANDPQAALNRARAAAYLTLASARYQVTR
jgi:hypothetical protein